MQQRSSLRRYKRTLLYRKGEGGLQGEERGQGTPLIRFASFRSRQIPPYRVKRERRGKQLSLKKADIITNLAMYLHAGHTMHA